MLKHVLAEKGPDVQLSGLREAHFGRLFSAKADQLQVGAGGGGWRPGWGPSGRDWAWATQARAWLQG